jgi:arabinogalactan endo-1,4-beta-galactosidase
VNRSFTERDIVQKNILSICGNNAIDMDRFRLWMPPDASNELPIFLS